MRATIIEGYKDGTKIYFCGDGHYYYSNVRKNGKIYLRCTSYYKRNCHGRAVCSEDLTEFESRQPHTAHRKTKSLPQVRELRRKILRDCASRHPARFSKVVWKNGQGYSRKVRSHNMAVRLRSAMRRARSKYLPDIPLNLEAAHEILSYYKHVHRTIDEKGWLYAGKCGSSKHQDHCLIFISKTMKDAMAAAQKVFADGTQDGTPSVSGCKQIYSITTTWDNQVGLYTGWRTHQIIPLCIVLMQRKTERSYSRVLQSLKHLVPDFNPAVIHCDFEIAQYNAWRHHFPHALIEGCLFHYAKDVSEYARSLGFTDRLQNDNTFYSIVRSCLSIPMVPEDDLLFALETIMARAHHENVLDELERYFKYLYDEWVTKRGHVLSVCESEDRTNNVAESWNAMLQKAQEEVHPNFFRFVDSLLRLEEEACQNIYCMKKGIPTGRPRKVSALRNDAEIQRLTRLLHEGNITMGDFLRQASFRILAPFSKIFPREGESDDSD